MGIQFTHRGTQFNLTKDDFTKAVKLVKPGRIQKYSVIVGGVEFPIRQVVAAGTGRPAIEFTSAAAYRILQKFGFDIKTDEKMIFSQKLTHKTETSEENITIAVEELPHSSGFHVSYGGTKNEWQGMPNASLIGGPIEGNPFSTAEIAIEVAKQVAQAKIKAGFSLVEVDGEPPSNQGDFQTHIRNMPPRR